MVVRYDAAQAAAPDSEPSALVVSVVNAFALSVLLALILGGLKLVGVRNGVLRCQFIFGTFFISVPFFTHVVGGMLGVVLGLFCWALTWVLTGKLTGKYPDWCVPTEQQSDTSHRQGETRNGHDDGKGGRT